MAAFAGWAGRARLGRSVLRRLPDAQRRFALAASRPRLDDPPVGSEADKALAAMLKAAGAGRMDEALKLAKTLAPGQAPAQFVAKECSERAARAFQDSWEARERAIGLAITGATFKIPGRGEFPTAALREGFWLREVSDVFNRTSVMAKLSYASLALRSLELDENFEKLQARCASADADALAEAAAVARDYHLIGKALAVRCLTSRPSAVIQAYIARTVAQDPMAVARHPAVMQLLLKAGRHFQEALGGDGKE